MNEKQKIRDEEKQGFLNMCRPFLKIVDPLISDTAGDTLEIFRERAQRVKCFLFLNSPASFHRAFGNKRTLII